MEVFVVFLGLVVALAVGLIVLGFFEAAKFRRQAR